MQRFLAFVPAIAFLLIWEWVASTNLNYRFMIGSPLEVMETAKVKIIEMATWRDLWASGSAVTVGFIVGTAGGTAAGLLLAMIPRVQLIVRWYLLFLGSIPILALGPMLILWFGVGWGSKVALAVLATSIISMQMARAGAVAVQNDYQDMIACLGPSRWALFRFLLLPGAATWVLEGARNNIGAAVLGVFIGECLNSQVGVGHMIMRASGLYRVSEVWFGISLLAFLSVFLFVMIQVLVRFLAFGIARQLSKA